MAVKMEGVMEAMALVAMAEEAMGVGVMVVATGMHQSVRFQFRT